MCGFNIYTALSRITIYIIRSNQYFLKNIKKTSKLNNQVY